MSDNSKEAQRIDIIDLMSEFKLYNVLNPGIEGFSIYHKSCGYSTKEFKDLDAIDLVFYMLQHKENCQ